MSLTDVLVRKLESIADLSPADRALVQTLPVTAKRLSAGEDLIRQGENPMQSVLLIKGVLARYQELPDGARQTVSFHFSGEIPDLHTLYIGRMDHSLGAISDSIVGLIPHGDLMRVIAASPSLTAILWRETLIDAAIFRQWITNNGRRGALAGTAHLICEFMTRVGAVGELEPDGSWLIPFTQTELSEALGISLVHLNRTLRTLRAQGLVTIERGRLTIGNWEGLRQVAGFDAGYLHLRV